MHPGKQPRDGPVDDEARRDLTLLQQKLRRAGRVPLRSRVGQRHDRSLVRIAGGHPEQRAHACRRVQQDPVKGVPRRVQQTAERVRVDRLGILGHGGGQQEEVCERRVLRRLLQGVFPAHERRKRQNRHILHPECNVEIPQADVQVDAQHAQAVHGQARRDPGAERGLARAALAGDDCQNLCHALFLPHVHTYPVL